ncbi:hypothetical protein KP22_13260 [Pectobacterium betavasculorum]|uniref:Uncharacterized protein n=1 Tax=Pectobacterium betavasculorum TaxID=55207 RepID=A0A093RWE0_9GAMM|nr:hypothetical protein KP22_13260 [Pectobacterium betavasculorum]KFX21745.1 hypothetical protein JV35_00875 [Pectobacterium betavasculorum]
MSASPPETFDKLFYDIHPVVEKEQRASAREPWLIFTNTDKFPPKKIMKLYRGLYLHYQANSAKS